MEHSQPSPGFYQQALQWTHKADKVINLVLSYLLAVASVLGFVDVLSNGAVLSFVPWAFIGWLIIMGLGVDLQILIVIGAVFTQHYDAPGPIASAMHTLRINAVAFVYERAALSTLLLVLMALDRMMERWRLQQGRMPGQEGEQTLPDEGKHQGADEQRDEAVARLAEQVAMLTHSLTQISTTVTEVKTTVTQITQDRKGLALSEPIPIHARMADATNGCEQQEEANTAQIAAPLLKGPEKPVRGEQTISYGERIEAVYSCHPTWTVREIAEQVGCSLSTANKWMQRLRPQGEQTRVNA